MSKSKKQPTLTSRVVAGWMVMLIISSMTIAIISYRMYMNQLLAARGEEAESVAIAMALRVDGDQFSEIMKTMEKNDYWYEVKDYADHVATVFGTAFIYILDANYDENVYYFAEGAPDDAPFDLGMTEAIIIDGEEVYAEEMFRTIETGEPSKTEPYASGDYGDMVSGFAAIVDKNNHVVGVVGVDFYFNDVQSTVNAFGFNLVLIVAAFSVFSYIVMTYLGNKMAGIPLGILDKSARQLALGDMDIRLDIRSKSEIGRLAKSFEVMVDTMKEQISVLEQVSQGDLTVGINPHSDKDTMSHAIVKILDSLNVMFAEINHSATLVSSGSRQISQSAQLLAQGASEQTGAVEQLSSSIAQVTSQANENLDVAKKATALADTIKSDASTGSTQMDRMTVAVKDITDASVAINKVIKVIDDIAFQTNILALNAAVEAARAGQHGKGFAVVAEEVRNLAAKSAEAAKDTGSLISNSMEKAQMGAAIAEETAVSLDRIIQGINECVVLVRSMAGSFESQIGTMSQINRGIEQVSQVVQQNSSTAEESAAASQEMSAQASVLHEMIGRFKIKDSGR